MLLRTGAALAAGELSALELGTTRMSLAWVCIEHTYSCSDSMSPTAEAWKEPEGYGTAIAAAAAEGYPVPRREQMPGQTMRHPAFAVSLVWACACYSPVGE